MTDFADDSAASTESYELVRTIDRQTSHPPLRPRRQWLPRRQPRSLSSAAQCPCHGCRLRAYRQSHPRRSPAHRSRDLSRLGGTMRRIAAVPRSCNPQPPVTRHDMFPNVHRNRAWLQCCGQQCLHRHRAADQSLPPGMPSVSAPTIDAIATTALEHPPRAQTNAFHSQAPARPRPPQSLGHYSHSAPNLPRFRSIRLLV
jgi:hypothetical protein